MIGNDRTVNRFLESIKENISAEQETKPEPISHVVINRAVRCTIIVGQPLPAEPRVGRQRRNPGKA